MGEVDSAPRTRTRQVRVGGVPIGGGAPVAVQSMTTTPTRDPEATLAQISELAEEGCEIARVAIPDAASLEGFATVCAASPLPVVADIHFDHHLAIEACRRGAAALRVNPGNIGSWDRVDAVIDAAKEAGIPIRIGVNAGSLARDVEARADLTHAEKLVESAVSFVRHFAERGFLDVVVSAKTHSAMETVEVNRLLSRALPEVPLHLGVTEAGDFSQATVKNSVALGILLSEGIGDTVRVSITAPPADEVRVAWQILAATGVRQRGPEIVSCPTCARCSIDLMALEDEVARRLREVRAPLCVAVMGCEVNGPGEARAADIGIAGGHGHCILFAGGEIIATVDQSEAVDALMAQIDARFPE